MKLVQTFRVAALSLILGLVCTASASVAQTATTPEQAVGTAFGSFDLNADGHVRPREAVAYLTLAFRSMDRNDDNRVSLGEFNSFSLGLLVVAEARGKVAAYTKARETIFKRWSKGNDVLTLAQMISAVRAEFAKIGAATAGTDPRLDLKQFSEVQFIKEMADSTR
ncbi:MAG: hypothetical protein ACRCUE_05785 [Bosea sp. (in: a-proteobacteria)]